MEIHLSVEDGVVVDGTGQSETITAFDRAVTPGLSWTLTVERLCSGIAGRDAVQIHTPNVRRWTADGRMLVYEGTLVGTNTCAGHPLIGRVAVRIHVDPEHPGDLAARLAGEPEAFTDHEVGVEPHPGVVMGDWRSDRGRVVGPVGPRCRFCCYANPIWDPFCRSCMAPRPARSGSSRP
jgi:hypothetical protein